METLISKLSWDRYKITSWNENLVRMDLVKSFITIELTKSNQHLGSDMGWTKYFNTEHKLVISGGWFKGVEWLESVEYGKNLHNKYNNYCTPLYLAPIMTNDGVEYFKEYYKKDISKILIEQESEISRFQRMSISASEQLEDYKKQLKDLSS